MRGHAEGLKTRRRFLRMLAGSPLLASPGLVCAPLGRLLASGPVDSKVVPGLLENLEQAEDVIASPDQAINVMDFELAAR